MAVSLYACIRARAESRSVLMVARRLVSMHRAKTALRSCSWHRDREKDREDGVNVSIKSCIYAVECQPELLVIFQLNAWNAVTLFSIATSRSRTLSCRSDRMYTKALLRKLDKTVKTFNKTRNHGCKRCIYQCNLSIELKTWERNPKRRLGTRGLKNKVTQKTSYMK